MRSIEEIDAKIADEESEIRELRRRVQVSDTIRRDCNNAIILRRRRIDDLLHEKSQVRLAWLSDDRSTTRRRNEGDS